VVEAEKKRWRLETGSGRLEQAAVINRSHSMFIEPMKYY
jgi:hypothetical protein